MNLVKKFFKGWNLFECVFVGLSWIVPITLGIIFESSALEVFSTSISLTSALLIAKGKIDGYFVGLAGIVAFSIVCFQTKIYGEVIVQLAIYLPVTVFGIYSWAKNKHNDKDKGSVVKVGYLGIKEILLVIVSQLIMAVGYYFMLKYFGTEYLLVSTFSVTIQVAATYMLARRSQFGSGPYVLGDIAQIVLWSMVVAGGNTNAIAVLVMPCMYLINDVYGFFEWRRLRKNQNTPAPVADITGESA